MSYRRVADDTRKGARPRGPVYDVFISYSRKDVAFATLLEQALEAYKPPQGVDLPQRTLEVFRDQQDFTGVEYSQALDRHLDESANMIVLCSPNSRASGFVDEEIRRFVAKKGADHLIPILLAGLPNHEGDPANPSDWAFPAALCEALPRPLAADYRGFSPEAHKLTRGTFAGAWYTTLANIYRISRNELEQRDLLRRRKARRRTSLIAGVTFAAIAASGMLALNQSDQARQQTRVAEERKKVAQARQLALHADAIGDAREDLASLLSVEAARRADILESKQSLLASLLRRPQLEGFLWGDGLSVTALQLSSDNRLLAAGLCQRAGNTCRKREIRLFDISSRKSVRSVDRNEGSAIISLAFGANDTLVAAGDEHESMSILDVLKGDTLHDFSLDTLGRSTPLWGVSSLAFSPDGKNLAVGSCGRTGDFGSCVDGQINVVETATWQMVGALAKLPGRPVEGMTFDPQGTLWLLLRTCPKYLDRSETCSEVEIRQWSLARRAFITTSDVAKLSLPASGANMMTRGGPSAMALTSAGEGVVSAYCSKPEVFRCVQGAVQVSAPGSVRVSEPLTGHVSKIISLAANADGTLLASGSQDGTIILWRTDTRSVLGESIPVNAATLFAVTFSPDGEKIAAGGCEEYRDDFTMQCQTSALFVISVKDRRVIPYTVPDSVGRLRAVAFSRDGRMLAAGSDMNRLLLWSAASETQNPEELVGPTQSVLALQFTPDSRTLVAAGKGGVVLWDVNSRKPRAHLSTAANRSLLTVAVSPDGKKLATGGEDRAITIWDLDNTSNSQTLTGHKGSVTALRFDAESKVLVSGAEDGIAVWDFASMQRRSLPFHGHEGPVIGIALSPHGEIVASGGLDRRVMLWDLESGQALGPLLSQEQAWRGIAFSPDGGMVAAVGHGSNVSLFLPDVRAWRELACRRANRDLTQQEWSEYFGTEPFCRTCADSS